MKNYKFLLPLLILSFPVLASNQGGLLMLVLILPLLAITIIALIFSLIFKKQGPIIMSPLVFLNIVFIAWADGIDNVLLNASFIISLVGLILSFFLKNKVTRKEEANNEKL